MTSDKDGHKFEKWRGRDRNFWGIIDYVPGAWMSYHFCRVKSSYSKYYIPANDSQSENVNKPNIMVRDHT